MDTRLPFDQLYAIMDALTLEYHKLFCETKEYRRITRVGTITPPPLVAKMLLAREATLRAYGWTNEAFQDECKAKIAQMASRYSILTKVTRKS